MNYCYIITQKVKPSDRLCDHYLYSSPNVSNSSYIIRIPVKDVHLRRVPSGITTRCYLTNDTRVLAEVSYDYLVRINWKWEVRNDLCHISSNKFTDPTSSLKDKGYTHEVGWGLRRYKWSYLKKTKE